MAEDDALAVLVELDYLELELLVQLSLRTVLLNEVLGSSEAFYAILQLDNGTLVQEFDDSTLVDRILSEYGLEYVPGVLLQLLVAERETTVNLVNLQYANVDDLAYLGELIGVLNLLGPAQVADVDEAVNTFLNLNEYAEVGEVANLSGVLAADGVLGFDGLPGIVLQLLDAQRHLALVAIQSQDNCLYLVTNLHEVLSAAQVLAPRHFANVDKTLYTGSNLNECTVVGHNHNLTLNAVAYLQLAIQSIPGMRSELLQTESDTLLLVVEVQDNNVDLLVELNNLAGIAYAAPAQVGDVDQTVNTAQVNEYTVRSDVLDGTLEYLTLLQLADDLLLLLLQLGLDESLVAYNNIAVLLVDLYDLELHGLAHEDIVVADGLNVNLRTGQEGLDAEYVDNHTTLCAALNVTLDNLIVVQSLVHTVPRLGCASLLVRQDELTLLVLLILDVHLNGVTYLQFGVVAEFAGGDDTIALETDVYNHLALVHCNYGAIHYVVVTYLVHAASVSLLLSLKAYLCAAAVLKCFPIEAFNGSYIFVICHTDLH